MPKIVGPRDLGHAHFQGKLFVCLLGIPDTELHTKFEVCSSSSFRDIALWAYWVTSLTFQGHVTSSVTWSFASPYAISYW